MCSTANLSPHSPRLVLTRSIQRPFPTTLLHSRSRILPTVALARLTRRFNRHSPTPRFRPTHFFLKCSPRAKPAGINSLYLDQYCGETSERILFLMPSTAHANSIAPISMKAAVSSITVAGSSRDRDTLALKSKILRSWCKWMQKRILRKPRKDAKR